jgi:O-antigen ligase
MTLLPRRDDLRELGDPLLLAYLAFVVSLPITRPGVFTLSEHPVMLSDLLMVLVYALFLRQWKRGRVTVRLDGLLGSSLLFLLALALSMVAAHALHGGALIKLAAYGCLVLLPSLTRAVVDTPARLRLVLAAWGAGAGIAVAVGLVGLLAFYLDRHGVGEAMMCGYGGLKSGPYPRLCAPFRHPNMFANYLALAMPLVLATGWGRLPRRWLVALVGAALVIGALTMSAGFAGLLGGLYLVVHRLWRSRGVGRKVALVLGGGAVAGAAGVLVLASVASVVPHGQGHLAIGSHDLLFMDGARPSIWRAAAANIAAHPLTGLGYGREVALVSDPRAFIHADNLATLKGPVSARWMEGHDVWLNLTGQAGFLGLATFAVLLFLLWRPTWPLLFDRDQSWRALGSGLWGAFVGAFLFHGIFAAIEEGRHIWALFALAAASASLLASRRPAEETPVV